MIHQLFGQFLRALTISAIAVSIFACNTPKQASLTTTTTTGNTESDTEYRQLDTMVVTGDRPSEYDVADTDRIESYALPPYNASHTRTNDLLHTKLEVSFDWANEKVMGKATLRFKPQFYPVSTLTLDAKGFKFNQVRMAGGAQDLKYDYDGEQITIQLGKEYTRDQEYTVFIDYVASPKGDGGSAAITSDRGLFFINPTGEDPNKPQQIWTQGETESNSRWFPTIDKPNERTTEEIYITVDKRFTTLSNGLMVSSTDNPDGTRTDYWKMDMPHAPYLFMMAIGEFATVKDQWEGIPVNYYVEPEFEKDAKAIFPYTPEMLSFFSEKIGVKYPWPKFSQVVVRDYVSGAMENTTAVIFGDFMQRHAEDLIDEHTNEKVVAHEMFHHWFGDYVTCESWANLTLNEGFANYSEYLWMEHKHGRDAADYHLLEEWSGYYNSGDFHPLINFGYEDREDMFDAHSYNKGGSVLHMLRTYLGDDAFFAGLKLYLTKNALTAVEVHNLRMAFEAVSGQDLNWFFNQWYLDKGHPVLNVETGYDADQKMATVTVEQTQTADSGPAIFILPTAVDIYTADGKKTRQAIKVDERKQTFTFPVNEKPALINFDPERELLAIRHENKSQDELLFQFDHAPRLLDRLEAIQQLEGEDNAGIKAMYQKALNDKFWAIRAIGLHNANLDNDALTKKVREMAVNDPRSEVRASAFDRLSEADDAEVVQLAKQAIDKDKVSSVVGAALNVLSQKDNATALEYAAKLENTKSSELLSAIGDIYAESGDVKYLPFFEKNLAETDGFAAISFMTKYKDLVIKAGIDPTMKAAAKLKGMAMDQGVSPWKRLGAARAITQMRDEVDDMASNAKDAEKKAALKYNAEELKKMFEQIKENETNDQLKAFYRQF